MTSQIIQQGAEAVIRLVDDNVIKERISKGYRIKELDEKLRFRRTKLEAKIIGKLKKVVNVPEVFETGKKEIIMEYINGLKLSEDLENIDWKETCKKIGESIGKIHNLGIIHGDLTTSNMILKDESVYFIDFGLGFFSHKIEDKAVDLHLLKQALEAKHFKIAEKTFKIIIKNYNADNFKEIIQRIGVIEKRGRYRH